MTPITIEQELLKVCPKLYLGCIECNVVTEPQNKALWQLLQQETETLGAKLQPEAVNALPNIARTRAAYKALGKDPSRYRPAAEALIRRIAQGKGIYQLNNVVDALNLVSVTTGFSIGGYDVHKLQGAVMLGTGNENEPYEAIGRGTLNIAGLPVFRDELGAFGTPTSDSERAKVTLQTTRFLMIIVNFNGNQGVQQAMQQAVNLLTLYAGASETETAVIG
ncbi:hypothetical protein C7N43_17455 [Sphingobacteriales bacterium UPWRP_1]|nr:hypothetical protein BVG80_04185 [Sphingobacteriales bacterium TSM_CSM]PSJ75752.1 hypothetical protein C7N43_17455 [Sphingobacteriales bacterium UPWRP_1]